MYTNTILCLCLSSSINFHTGSPLHQTVHKWPQAVHFTIAIIWNNYVCNTLLHHNSTRYNHKFIIALWNIPNKNTPKYPCVNSAPGLKYTVMLSGVVRRIWGKFRYLFVTWTPVVAENWSHYDFLLHCLL
jgi:hypothetical protein